MGRWQTEKPILGKNLGFILVYLFNPIITIFQSSQLVIQKQQTDPKAEQVEVAYAIRIYCLGVYQLKIQLFLISALLQISFQLISWFTTL